MKYILTILSLAFFLSVTVDQTIKAQNSTNPWELVAEKSQSEEQIAAMRSGDFFPVVNYKVFRLDTSQMSQLVNEAPFEDLRNFESDALVPIPLPSGGYEYFRIAESPVFAPELAADFPNIKSYKAISEGNSGRTGRISVSPIGVAGMFNTVQGDLFIERYEFGEPGEYAVFYGRDMAYTQEMQQDMRCGYEGIAGESHRSDLLDEHWATERRVGGNMLELRVYRMALAATSAYSELKGGTMESVMASLNEAMNILNQITENEVAIRFELVPNNQNIVWLDPDEEPYENIDVGSGLLGQNTSAIASAGGIPLNQFDVGHVFTGRCVDVGGVVNGRACTPGKARGVTCHSNNNLSSIVTRIFSHEVGHQFQVAHSWNHCPGSDNQRAPSSAFEPGSGSTIMSYAGACGSQNVQTNTHAYFHSGSLNEWIVYSRLTPDNENCGEVLFTGNTEPEVHLPYENDFFIPVNTPFKLTAEATDADDDPLTFCWEQVDLGPDVPMSDPVGTVPLFRTFPPNPDPTRYFPNLVTLSSGSNDLSQQLPSYSRALNFRCTVRDNNPAAGAAVWDQLRFFSSEAAGPFRVTFPGFNETYSSGELVEITWDVANTDQSPVNAEYVDILFSFNRGFAFPIVLMERTPNTGSALVHMPDIAGPWNRIKVRASDNIFFNVSERNFALVAADEPTYIFRHNPGQDLRCLPDELRIEYRIESVQNFNDSIKVEIVSGLPDGAELVAFPEWVFADTEGEFVIDLRHININAEHELEFRLIAGQDTLNRSVFFETVSNDFSEIALTAPANGIDGVDQSIAFSWEKSENAELYELEIATNPAFNEEDILFRELVGDVSNYQPNLQFPASSILYWRVKPFNQCGFGEPTVANVFQTRTLSCQLFEASGHPISAPGSNGSVTRSDIFIDAGGEVGEINIPKISGLQSWVGDIGFKLISPSGTEVALFTRKCGNLSHYNLGFDDNSPLQIECPLDRGHRYQPEEPLSAFAGEPLQGLWQMELRRYASGSTGQWNSWSMEVCANFNLPRLQYLQTDTLFAPPLKRTGVSSHLIQLNGADAGPSEVVFTVVKPPTLGSLIYDDADQDAGFEFSQQDILDGRVRYRADIDGEGEDYFTFTVRDDRFAWTGPETFHIAIREDAVSNVNTLVADNDLKIFPNPGQGLVTLLLDNQINESASLRVFNVEGKMVANRNIVFTGGESQVDISHLPSGFYIVKLLMNNRAETGRLIIK
jgi:hypothetical protein